MMLANDEPVVPTMREQIEGLIAKLKAENEREFRFITNTGVADYYKGKRKLSLGVINSLCAILDSEN